MGLTFDLKFPTSFDLKWYLMTFYMKNHVTIITYHGNLVINAKKFDLMLLSYDVTLSDLK